MGVLRQLFGPSQEEIWRQLCAALDARYVDGGWWRGDQVQARHGEWTVTLDTVTVKDAPDRTRIRAPYINPDGFRFEIYRSGIFSGLGKWLGMQDIDVGHEPFDKDFVVKGNDAAKVRQLLSSPRLRELLAGQPEIHFSVADDEGWTGPDYPKNADVLCFDCEGVIMDVKRLKLLYALFAETLDQLCRIGSAYEEPANVTL
jgi:hypothetical protein